MSTPAPPRTGLTVAGALVVLLALTALIAGAALLAVDAGHRDDDGFYSTGARRLATPARAIVSDRLDADLGGLGSFARDGRLGTLRVTADAAAGGRVFLGVARTAPVDAYLRDVARETVTDVEVDPLRVSSRLHAGARVPAPPATRTFWAASATGAGRQTLTWKVQDGTWAVVLMNADAGPRVAADVAVGAKVPFVRWMAIGLLGAGVAGLLGGGALLVAGTRRRRSPAAA